MTDVRVAEQNLHQAQKMQALGQLTGGIAHDFNNLMTPALLNLELLGEIVPDQANLQQLVTDTMASLRRGADLTRQLLTFSRSQTLSPKPTDVNALIHGMTRMMRRTLDKAVTITNDLSASIPRAQIDPGQLENTILNLVLNARDAIDGAGEVKITTLATTITERTPDGPAPGRYVIIRVSDNGSGMSEQVRSRAFEPFFSTKEVGEGTGLGLSMVYGFVSQSGGSVELSSAEGSGTAVTLRLPAASDDAGIEASPKRIDTDTLIGGGQNILLVEDSDGVRVSTARALTRMGYNIVEVRDGKEASAVIMSDAALDLVFSDIGLPGGMSGVDIAFLARQHRPDVQILLTTGYAPDKLADSTLPPDVPVMMKPYDLATLADRIRGILGN